MQVLKDGNIVGMLGVYVVTGQVMYYSWMGTFMQLQHQRLTAQREQLRAAASLAGWEDAWVLEALTVANTIMGHKRQRTKVPLTLVNLSR